jgi:hypothetical protein
MKPAVKGVKKIDRKRKTCDPKLPKAKRLTKKMKLAIPPQEITVMDMGVRQPPPTPAVVELEPALSFEDADDLLKRIMSTPTISTRVEA